MPLLPFDEVFADQTGGNIKTPQSEYKHEGRFPVIDQGKALVAGYVDDQARICGNGRPAIVFGDHTRCVKYVDVPFCLGADGVKVLRPKIDANLKYLFYFLRQVRLPDGGYDRHFKYLKRSMVAFPSLPEQRRIAAILDKADALGVKRREALSYLQCLPRSIYLEMFGHPIENPKRFPTESLVNVCQCYSGGTPSKSNASFWQGDLPWYSAKDLKHTDLFDSQDHINRSVPRTTNLKLLPQNTVAIVVRGMILAHTFPVSVLRTESTINQDLKALIPRFNINAQYLAWSLRVQENHVLQQVSEAGHGTKRLDSEALREIIVPIPRIELQEEFAARVTALEELSRVHQLARGNFDSLFASLQHRAFTGTL